MELTGKVIQVLPISQGVAKNTGNPWRKLEFIVETLDSSYPKKICFELFGEKIDQNPVSVGTIVTVNFDLTSREYNSRWFTQVSAYRVVPSAGNATAPQLVQTAPQATVAPQTAPAAATPAAPASAPTPTLQAPPAPATDELPF